MTTLSEWLKMGGYAQYVWPSYALALLAVLLNIRWARRSARQARMEARRRLAATRGDA
jgi:heme exporter protein CcmD